MAHISELCRDQLIALYTPLAKAGCRRFIRSGLDPADLLQEAMTALIAAVDGFDAARGPLGPHAATLIHQRLNWVCKREALRHGWSRLSVDPDDFAAPADQGPTEAEYTIYREDLLRMVRISLDALNPEQQDLLTRRFGLDGEPLQSCTEIGEQLGIPSNTVAKRTQYAMERVRDHFHALGWTADTWPRAIA